MAVAAIGNGAGPASGDTRRDFLYLTAGAFGAIGSALALWPFIASMNPAADVLALGTTEVTLTPIEPGQRITVKWRGRPVFIDRRTPERIAAARGEDFLRLPDPESDAARVKNPEWLVVVGICTHLGCVPLGQRPTDPRGEYGGWFRPCHGSHYDTSGRIRKGPAPRNLAIPPYTFIDPATLRIG